MRISVIVPCFNVGNLLQPLLQSLKEQDFQDFEAIFVNDGSTDDTVAVLKKYCDNERYKWIDKQNGGPGSARNAGLAIASGEYVFFVDGDDYIFPKTLSKLEELLVDGVDVAVGAFVNTDGITTYYPKVFDKDKWLRLTFTTGGLTLVNKMFRRSIIEQHHLRFDEQTRKSEDHLFTAGYMRYCKGGISVTDYPVYCYVLNPMSISNREETIQHFSKTIADSVYASIKIYNLLEGYLSRATLMELRYDTYHKYRRIRHAAHVLNCKDKNFYNGIYAEIRKIMPVWEIVYFAIRRRISIITKSLWRKTFKWLKHFK